MHWLYLILAIVAEGVATSALTAADGFARSTSFVSIVAGYGMAFFLPLLTPGIATSWPTI